MLFHPFLAECSRMHCHMDISAHCYNLTSIIELGGYRQAGALL